MPAYRTTLASAGFIRAGQRCERSDGGLHRTLSVYTRATGARPQVQLLVRVAVAGLPAPVTVCRHDGVGGTAETASGNESYPLPARDRPLPPDLLTDVAGPVLEFLMAAKDLTDFVVWAQDIHLGREHPGWWGRFRPVLPQGTGPLEAAAFAAAVKHDTRLVELLTARVENEQADENRYNDFLIEIQRLRPSIRPRHPIVRPVS
ncbi:hypothetical protein Daura_16405 [Dactylosporangium aurantiacum]|uniref:Uncharacterized protein n=1 Tax=Dactylosporangium aurantiacum TaxID=35754 RepID=A0A9Q9IL69_9ACTN|nr:hypothetical protein [Dactylosporangium aurantiacum]UWZ57601.1 hypothetical protein Daura_16405 [Dactylosporangium aurantiacum]